jgi:hypothetical protein
MSAAHAPDEVHAGVWHRIKTWAVENGYAYLLPASIPGADRFANARAPREIVPYGDSLLDVFRSARALGLSWDIGRGGDGAPELRDQLRAAVGYQRWRPEVLAGCAATLPLEGASQIVGFPDWLGYLGVILDEVGRHPPSLLRLGAAWAPEFIRVGGATSTWERYGSGKDLLTWRTLELAEREGLGGSD